MITIAERCADPAFQRLIKRAHARHWADGERREMSAPEIAEAILRSTCGVTGENHPEFRALVSALERTQVADECVNSTT